jgi:citrate lyase subunit beta/citryl-CoA lyase
MNHNAESATAGPEPTNAGPAATDGPAPRSYLYVPGDAPTKLARAVDRGADALIVDLEDAVPVRAKQSARESAADFLAHASAGPLVYVRINADAVEPDIAAVCGPRLSGVVVPKASVALLAEVDQLLLDAERRLDLPANTFTIIALIESAAGILSASQIAASPRVSRLGIGEADLIGELGLQPGPDRAELAPIRLQVVLASAAAGRLAPIAPVETRLGPDVDLAASTRALLAAGFRARTAIHPNQVPVINEVFTPSPDEVRRAEHVLATLGEQGVAVDENGHMLDPAVVRAAREILARAAMFRP